MSLTLGFPLNTAKQKALSSFFQLFQDNEEIEVKHILKAMDRKSFYNIRIFLEELEMALQQKYPHIRFFTPIRRKSNGLWRKVLKRDAEIERLEVNGRKQWVFLSKIKQPYGMSSTPPQTDTNLQPEHIY